MNPTIKTNQLEPYFDFPAIDARYDFFRLETDKSGYLKKTPMILDIPEMSKDILSLFFDYRGPVYLMMTKGANDYSSQSKLRLALDQIDEESFSYKKVSCQDLSSDEQKNRRILLSLLLNALGSSENKFFKCGNLTGRLYCFDSDWRKEIKGKTAEIASLQFQIDDGLLLEMYVRTFTATWLKSKMRFGKKKFPEYTQYVPGPNMTLHRKTSSDNSDAYILKKRENAKKTRIHFVNLYDNKEFRKTKMGVLESVLNLFRERYNGLCQIHFHSLTDYTTEVARGNMLNKEDNVLVSELLDNTPIRIVDGIGTEASKIHCQKMSGLIQEYISSAAKSNKQKSFQTKIPVGTRIVKNAINLYLIHNSEHYAQNKLPDPHQKLHPGAVVQHVTMDQEPSKEQMRTLIHEALIKQDLLNRKISLFDWNKTGFKEDITFGIKKPDDNGQLFFYYMTIHPDGTFDLLKSEAGLKRDHPLYRLQQALRISDSFTLKGSVQFGNEDINMISDTKMFTIPEIDLLHEKLKEAAANEKNGKAKIRNKETGPYIYSALTNIRLFEKDGKQFYWVGKFDEGIPSTIATAANIRSVEPYDDSKLRFDELLMLMNVVFVRNGQLTVIPFPFKYLREYITETEKKAKSAIKKAAES